MSIALIDEHPLLAEGVMQVLRASGNFAFTGIGSTIEDAVGIAQAKRPDLMILEINLVGSGLEAARQVTSISPRTKIVFLTSSENEEHISAALRDGAKGYILKGIDTTEFVRVIVDIGNGHVYVNPAIAARMLGRGRNESGSGRDIDSLADLTAREREIITHVAQGKTNKEVAVGLRLGEKTVKHHMTSIMQKLQVRNRLEAVLVLKSQVASEQSGPMSAPRYRVTSHHSGLISSKSKLDALYEAVHADSQRRS